ncbi:hypothetical protein DFH28DRAFT_1080314 [Melampsora americana]|nr:hypothetical protein DFH28DRAFT_1080314 [Melampsora americana]
MTTNVVLHYPKLANQRRIDPQRPLTVATNSPTGFRCLGRLCCQKPIHSSYYYDPRNQPNEPLIGLKCPLFKDKDAIRTYKRLDYLQDICTLNHARLLLAAPNPQASSPSARGTKRNSNELANLTDPMFDLKRARLPCTGIVGVGPHQGKAKHANRQCPWQACTDCCRDQRVATGSKCHTHENGERAKKIAPNAQPFLNTVLETAIAEASISRNPQEIQEVDLLGPAPPVHPLALAPSTMRMYHLIRAKEEDATRAAEAADSSTDKNISISLWLKEDSDPISFLFALKSMKQYAISECDALMIFLKAHNPHWNSCLVVYDVRADRWNYTTVGTNIPMLTPLCEALVCLTGVDPKLCNGMHELQLRLAPAARTSVKAIVDSLRATPTKTKPAPITQISAIASPASGSGLSYNGGDYSPTPTPYSQRTILENPTSMGAYRALTPPSALIQHATPYEEAEDDEVISTQGPKFSHNILITNQSRKTPPVTLTTSKTISASLSDTNNPQDTWFSSSPAMSESEDGDDSTSVQETNHQETTVGGAAPAPTQEQPNVKKGSKRRTKKTGLWPPPEMPMQRMIEWYVKHKSTKGKKAVWESFFSPEYQFEKTAMYRYIRWINSVTTERWQEWFQHCERNNLDAVFATAKLPNNFGKVLDEIR